MTGTIINTITVLIGGTIGLLFGSRLPEKVKQTVVISLGLFTFGIGVKMFIGTQNSIIVLVSLLLGGILGELSQIEDRLQRFGGKLERIFIKNNEEGEQDNRFIRGFITASLVFCVGITASLVFCVGPMTILGAIQDGLSGDYRLLAIKSVLDGFASLAFSSSLGVGVLFSVIVVIGYQGGLSLLATQAQALISESMITEMTAVGGILLIGISISSLLEIKTIRVGNFLPSLVIAPLIVAGLVALNISVTL
jgi:uncharacterized membrane protein YqgA involved in biofilm formation